MSDTARCETCNGNGQICISVPPKPGALRYTRRLETCARCNGTGRLDCTEPAPSAGAWKEVASGELPLPHFAPSAGKQPSSDDICDDQLRELSQALRKLDREEGTTADEVVACHLAEGLLSARARIAALEAVQRDLAIIAERYLVPYHKDERQYVCTVCKASHPNQWDIEHGMSCDIRALLPAKEQGEAG